MFHLLAEAAWRHSIVVAVATVDLLIGLAGGLVVLGAEVPDAALIAGVLFVLGTGTGVIGWALVLLVKLSNVVAELKTTSEDHERRLGRMEGR